MYHIYINIVIAAAAATAAVAADCLSFDNAVSLVSSSSNGKFTGISDSCFCTLLSSRTANSSELIPFIETYTRTHPINDTVLFCAYRLDELRNNESVFSVIIQAWKRRNPSPAQIVQRYQQAGAFYKMDTLCAILDYNRNLDAYLLLRWIDAKQVLDDLDPVPQLFGRILHDKPELLSLALNRFGNLLKDVTSERAASLLSAFCKYGIGNDTVIARETLPWVIEQYGAKRLFDEQVQVVTAFAISKTLHYKLLYDVARHHIITRNYIPAANAARAAYLVADDTGQKQEIAALLFKSYKERRVYDSARIWFERAGMPVAGDPYEKIDVLLNNREYNKAAEHIQNLPESFVRDTLILCRMLLSDSPGVAFNIAFSEKNALAQSPVAMLWRVRTALFTGNTGKCRELLDSINITSSDANAAELLDYRYWMMRLSHSTEDLAKFVQIEYTMFKGERRKASRIVCGISSASENKWRLAVRTARRQLESADYTGAIETLQCVPARKDPEYLFCYAEALYRNKEMQKSKKILERIILEFPSGIYTAQARNLLMRIVN